jgi:hypothetical protein
VPRTIPHIALILTFFFQASIGRADDSAAVRSVNKILFLGNSITRHGPAPKIGWTADWGMAASAREKDFVHLVVSALAQGSAAEPRVMIENIAAFERRHATYDLDANLRDAFGFKADLIIVAIGENVPKLATEESKAQFSDSFGRLLRRLKAGRDPIVVVRGCFWADQAKDEILRRGCRNVGGTFVDIGALGKNEANYARSEREFRHKGVAAHPGDRGMRAIADAILQAIGQPTSSR